MGLMQQALETYRYAEKKYAGVYFAEADEPLAPVGHTITKAKIEITINKDGLFLEANKVDEDDEKTIYSVTEESVGRTSGAARKRPHPLCDKLQYYIPSNTVEYECYIKQLEEWTNSEYSHPILSPLLKYIKRGTILEDLKMADLLKIDDKGNIKNEGDFVRWIVNGIDENSGPCWKCRSLQESYINWYRSLNSENMVFCMISGEKSYSAKQHAKGIVSLNGNAKLISTNDNEGFSYRGRFLDASEALTVGYDTSQKAHNALRWVIANQGVYFGGRLFVGWNPQGKKLPKVTGIMARRNNVSASYTPTAYREQLRNTLNSWKKEYPEDARAVTAVFDAATKGRLAVVYYSEFQATDFVDRLAYWDETCCWPSMNFGIQSPVLSDVVDYAFGTLRSNGYETDDNIKKNIMLQLVMSRIERAAIPVTIERALVQRAGNLQVIPDDKEHKFLRNKFLFATCAVIRKYHIDHFKEDFEMGLEAEKHDRSYQFGRWMAIMEKIERDTYDIDDKREPNIIRRQHAFTIRPYATAVSVMEHLKMAYYPQLSVYQRSFYEKKIEQIMDILSDQMDMLNNALGDSYLMGYYLQKKELYTSNKEKEEE